MDSKNKVSAIITTHKRSVEIVRRAVMSVIRQTYENIEIIVVDDSPNDYPDRFLVESSVKQLSLITDKKILYVKHEAPRGACAARNTGLNLCTGSIIGYLDDDDEWLPLKVEKMIEGFITDKIALVYCDSEVYNSSSNRLKKVIHKKRRGKIYSSLILRNYIGSTSFPLIRKECLISIGGFDEEMESAQDSDVWLRLSQQYEINYVNEILVRYHEHNGDRISNNAHKKINGLERINLKNMNYLLQHPNAFWVRYMKIIPYYFKASDKYSAWKTFFMCVKKCPWNLIGNIAVFLYCIIHTTSGEIILKYESNF